jgi:hypothetical protein
MYLINYDFTLYVRRLRTFSHFQQLPDKSIHRYHNNTMGITCFGRKGYSVRISTVATQVSPRVYSVSQSTFRGNYHKQATAIWFTNISRFAHFIQIREVTESEAKERSPMQNESAGVRDLPLSACCIPLHTQWPVYTSSKGLSLTRIITTNIRVKGMARGLKGKIGQYIRVENSKSLRGMWWGSTHRTSVGSDKLKACKAKSPSKCATIKALTGLFATSCIPST